MHHFLDNLEVSLPGDLLQFTLGNMPSFEDSVGVVEKFLETAWNSTSSHNV